MSTNFSAEQYEQEFASKRLQNYQVPKCKQSKNPAKPKGEITYIANEKGHLLPGVGRSCSNPFGDYIGTWNMPKTIPGPYNLNSMGRTNNNLQKISEKKREAAQVILEARENQKPLALRQSATMQH